MNNPITLRGRKSLRRQIYIITIVAVLLIGVAGISVYAFVSNLLVQKELRHVDSVVHQLSVELNTLASSQAQLVDLVVQNHHMLNYLRAGSSGERFTYWQSLSDTMNTMMTLNTSMDILLIFDNQRLLLNRSKNSTSYSVLYTIEEMFPLYTTESLDTYSGPVYDRAHQNYYYIYLRSIFDSTEGASIGKKLGTIALLSRLTGLKDIVQNANLTENAHFAVLDKQGNPVIAAEEMLPFLTDQFISQLPTTGENNITLTVNGQKLLIHTPPVSQMGWQVVSVIPLLELNADLEQFIVYAAGFLLCVLLLYIFVMLHVLNNIMKPIIQIATFAQHSAEYSLSHRLSGIADNEIGQLASYINQMLDAIDDLTKRHLKGQQDIYSYELAKIQAELSALQSQINPHFLYNTLDCIKGFGYYLGSGEVVNIASNLSFIMRYCIKGPDKVTLGMELMNIDKYLEIINIRF